MNVELVLSDADGMNLSGTVTITANCSPTPLKVEFYVDNNLVHSDTASPFNYAWDTTSVSDGTHQIRVEAVYKTRRARASESVTVTNTSPAPPPPPPPTPGPTGGLFSNPYIFFKLGAGVSGVPGLNRYGVLIGDGNNISTLNAQPGKSFTYTNCSQVVSAYSQGFSYSQANAGGWILGSFDSGTRFVLDHRSQAMNDAQAQADHDYCIAQGADGIYLDDTIPKDPYGFGGATLTDAYRAGVVYFVHKLRDLLHASGKYLICNANGFADSSLGDPNNGQADIAWANMILPDAVMTEGFAETRDGSSTLRTVGTAWNQLWNEWEAVPGQVNGNNVGYVALAYNMTNYFTYGSFLLIWTPGMNGYTAPNDINGNYITAHGDPGTALESRTQVGSVWRRRFTNYTVYVNPTGSSASADGHTVPSMQALFV